MNILVETSARHVHVTEADLETLFGKGYQLTVKKELSQPGQYASNERVTVVGPKKELANVSILGPCRSATQVELSMTDARSIGTVSYTHLDVYKRQVCTLFLLHSRCLSYLHCCSTK